MNGVAVARMAGSYAREGSAVSGVREGSAVSDARWQRGERRAVAAR